jgi:hypothetical protein
VVLAREQARWAAGCHQNIQTDPIPARTVGLQTEFVAPQVCVDSVCKYIYIYIYIYVCVCWVGMVSSEVIAVGYCILKVRFLLVTQKYLHKRPVAMLQYMDICALDAHPATCTGTYCADSNVCIFRLCVCFDEYLKPWAV